MNKHEELMQRALDLAALAKGKTSPNPMVGAVIVKNGEIIGEGYHKKAGTPHAEVHALRQAGQAAQGATMYVTLEPCSHTGRTPPCADAIIKAGITKVFAAMQDPNPKVSGQGFAKLRAAGIEVEVGILQEHAVKMNEIFLHYITTRLPFVALKTAATLDAKVATSSGKSKWITGQPARTQVHALRAEYDAVMTGIGTVLADDPELTVRHIESDKQPLRVILDSKLRIPLHAKILQGDTPTLIFTGTEADKEKVSQLTSQGIEVCIINNNGQQLDIAAALKTLSAKGITSVLVEAGPHLVTSFLKENKVDKWIHFIAPKLFGKDAHSFYSRDSIDSPAQAAEFEISDVQRFGADLMLQLYPRKGEE